jgi:hypothetical protein
VLHFILFFVSIRCDSKPILLLFLCECVCLLGLCVPWKFCDLTFVLSLRFFRGQKDEKKVKKKEVITDCSRQKHLEREKEKNWIFFLFSLLSAADMEVYLLTIRNGGNDKASSTAPSKKEGGGWWLCSRSVCAVIDEWRMRAQGGNEVALSLFFLQNRTSLQQLRCCGTCARCGETRRCLPSFPPHAVL